MVAKTERFDESVAAQHIGQALDQFFDLDLVAMELKPLFKENVHCNQTGEQNQPHHRPAVFHQVQKKHIRYLPGYFRL
ncbi:hypothetical protein SDC9_161973 [bioreactor metagenome]|uniref:Uncharacterized protein n=1 Tax=bioreactor metagenome TaxID=1076179 RepID=A0A645FLW0_9ZZZZ